MLRGAGLEVGDTVIEGEEDGPESQSGSGEAFGGLDSPLDPPPSSSASSISMVTSPALPRLAPLCWPLPPALLPRFRKKERRLRRSERAAKLPGSALAISG